MRPLGLCVALLQGSGGSGYVSRDILEQHQNPYESSLAPSSQLSSVPHVSVEPLVLHPP